MKIYDKLLFEEGKHGGKVIHNIGRGGFYGMWAHDALFFMGLPVLHSFGLPPKVGFSLEDKGGGINVPRVLSIEAMTKHGVPLYVAKKVASFRKACRLRYEELNEGDDFIL
jgi:hypothetical protein